jgi:hypothetical protein
MSASAEVEAVRTANELHEKVTELILNDPCGRRCLQGKAAVLEQMLSSLKRLTRPEEKVSIMTALAILYEAEEARPQRVRSTGERTRFKYYLPFVGQVCKTSFLQCYGVSAPTIARYKAQITQGRLIEDEYN